MNMLSSIRLLGKKTLIYGAHWSGFGFLYNSFKAREGTIVLMYHSVASDDLSIFIDPRNRLSPVIFEKQMKFLSAHRKVISLKELLNQIRNKKTPESGTVCITFDDGYLDNLTTAAPILERYSLPATLFLATGYIQRGESQWADTLHWIISFRTSSIINIPVLTKGPFELKSGQALSENIKSLHRILLEALPQDRLQILAELQRQLQPEPPQPRLTLNWEDVRNLCKKYPLFEIGGHTREHIDLRTHQGKLAESEILGCATDIKRELGLSPQNFSFPYGRWNENTKILVKQSGWSSAVGISDQIRVDQNCDLLAIPRIEAPSDMTEFRFKTSGAYPGALSWLGVR